MPSGNTHNGVWNAGIVQGDKGLSRIPHFDVVKSNPTPKQGSSSHSQAFALVPQVLHANT